MHALSMKTRGGGGVSGEGVGPITIKIVIMHELRLPVATTTIIHGAKLKLQPPNMNILMYTCTYEHSQASK